MPQRVLIIEDDPVSRELLSVLLAVEGFDVLLAESGEEALQQLRSDAVDLILTDMQMPGISGAELAAKLRTVCGKKIRLFAMSASQPQAAALAGYDGFLLKPFDGAMFSKAIAGGTESIQQKQPALDDLLNKTVYGKMAASMKPEQLREIYTVCLEDSRRRIANMGKLSAAGDDAGFRGEAHAIKGACSMLGAVRLAAMAAAMESGGIKGLGGGVTP